MFLMNELIDGVIAATLGNTIGTSPTSKEFTAIASNPTLGLAFEVFSGTLEFKLDLSAIISETETQLF